MSIPRESLFQHPARVDDGRYWPVVADFFVTVLAVFVLLYAAAERPDPILRSHLDKLSSDLELEEKAGNVLESDVNEHWIRIVYSATALGFAPCEWTLPVESAQKLRLDLGRLEPLSEYVSLLQIEGHADLQPATNCSGLRFKSNFELSENRAMSVFAALLGQPIDGLDEVVRRMTVDEFSGTSFIERMTASRRVLVAGFGATRLFERAKHIPDDPLHRRVEVRVTLRKLERQ